MEPRAIAKYQDEVMSSQLKQDVLKNWMCLDDMDPIRFVRKRYDRYAARQTIITNQVQFFEEAIRLRKLFDLDFVVPKIVEAISIKRRIIAGVVWDQVQGQDFIRELTLATDSAFQLAFRFKDSEHYLFEIEMKVDTEFNKIPPTIDNTNTKKLPQFFSGLISFVLLSYIFLSTYGLIYCNDSVKPCL
ncbi:uncharacterized protein LOC110713456 [Chenopodium quinoa]|uniref:uncharacterized protein LOC110713456 n=1 Tax=Chenopodium quinoa TaxID=63459 RepID=UPI000B76B8BD|nr:uncharacterized protein LOC110713456 [Chenopodium quinoa]XP_021747593.1 uncharacterized protein LOC110713456 [Chenopodium quinoa]